MESYQEVNTDDGDDFKDKKYSRSILKQSFICSTVWMQYLNAGLCLGAPTVFLPQIRKEVNSTYVIDDELSSWLYVVPCVSGIPWAIILPFFTKRVGRKIPQTITSVVSMIVFLMMYCSSNVYHILISEVIQGYIHAVNTTVGILSITEYCSPKLRGFFLTFTAAAFYWGIWVSNAIGTFFHWKNIALVGMVCSIYTLTVLFWPESPFWLASKGFYEESKTSFRWIHGFESSEEFAELIVVKQKDLELKTEKMSLMKTIRCPEFYKPLILSTLVDFQFLLSGKMVCCIYILDIFKSITSSEDSAYVAMFILDGATVLCIYTGTYLAKILKRRTLYITSSFAGVFCLFSISLYLFLIKLKLLEVNNYIALALLIAFSVSMSIGPMIFSSTLYGELVSTKYQVISYMIVVISVAVSYSVWVKLAPKVFAAFGLDGSFFFYGIACGTCTLLLYLYLPETKDKSQHDIDNLFKN